MKASASFMLHSHHNHDDDDNHSRLLSFSSATSVVITVFVAILDDVIFNDFRERSPKEVCFGMSIFELESYKIEYALVRNLFSALLYWLSVNKV